MTGCTGHPLCVWVCYVQPMRVAGGGKPTTVSGQFVCVCVGGGENNINEGDPYGSRAPVVVWVATKISAAYSVCATLFGARRGRSWGSRLGQNLWWGGVT